jgi:hypothetical protein
VASVIMVIVGSVAPRPKTVVFGLDVAGGIVQSP